MQLEEHVRVSEKENTSELKEHNKSESILLWKLVKNFWGEGRERGCSDTISISIYIFDKHMIYLCHFSWQ